MKKLVSALENNLFRFFKFRSNDFSNLEIRMSNAYFGIKIEKKSPLFSQEGLYSGLV